MSPPPTTLLESKPAVDPLEKSRRKKILFLGAPLTGHMTPLVRLMSWFHEHSWEVHMVPHAEFLSKLPEWVVVHGPIEDTRMGDFSKALFGKIGAEVPDGNSSFVQMLNSFSTFPMDGFKAQLKLALGVIESISPAAVVCDAMWNMGNHMHTFCTARAVPLAVLVCMGRPDPALGQLTMLWMMLRHAGLRQMRRMMATIGDLAEDMRPISGRPLPDSNKPVMLLPGTDALLESRPAPHELVCGPFLRLPPARESGGLQRPAEALAPTALDEELRKWLLAEPGVPVVYVAFGSLARLTEGMAGRLAEALRSASWRVLWVLDERSRQLLPENLRVSDGRWRLESWVAQYDVLSFEGVRCFVSHCGGNSSLEALSLGIPMVCMPFFCDQFDWASAIGNHAKAGIVVDKFESTSNDIRAALQSALEDSSVKGAALQVALDMRRELEEKQSKIVTHSNEEELPGVAVAANLIVEMTAGKDPTRHFRAEQSQGVLSDLISICARRKND